MPVTVCIPAPMRQLTGGQTRLEAAGDNVAAALDDLDARFPGLRERILDQKGRIRHFVNVFVNQARIDSSSGPAMPLSDGDEVTIVPAMVGGATPFSEEQITRYSRHIILSEVGGKGQRRLLAARVLVVGAGGLGSPVALYLAAAGVGTLGIVDFDNVDLSNLQRQILHHTHDVGRPKVESAAETITQMNPDVKVEPHQVALSSENALGILSGYDIIVSATDNFATRYLTNDAAVLLGKPVVDGSIFRFEGQATVYQPGKGCYRCLFPAPPPPDAVPSCAEVGVLGVLPGIIGCIQATETIKLILGIGEPLSGRLLLYDALTMEFREVRIRRDPACPICGDNPTIKELIDYEAFCGVPPRQ